MSFYVLNGVVYWYSHEGCGCILPLTNPVPQPPYFLDHGFMARWQVPDLWEIRQGHEICFGLWHTRGSAIHNFLVGVLRADPLRMDDSSHSLPLPMQQATPHMLDAALAKIPDWRDRQQSPGNVTRTFTTCEKNKSLFFLPWRLFFF